MRLQSGTVMTREYQRLIQIINRLSGQLKDFKEENARLRVELDTMYATYLLEKAPVCGSSKDIRG